ncbi:MAG: SDR family NAD(P)-dependent oxidoreductase, partial [Aquihabitans sp.]
MSELFSVDGKVVVVTGGTRGIGRMIAGGFVAGGATVIVSSRKADACAATAEELSAYGSCTGIAADLSTEEGAQGLADAVAALHDHVDVLVNNAGATWGVPLAEHDTAS